MLSATIEEGFQAIVKILYSISVSKTHATASEVATVLSPYGRRDFSCVKLKLELNMLVPVFLLNAVVVHRNPCRRSSCCVRGQTV